MKTNRLIVTVMVVNLCGILVFTLTRGKAGSKAQTIQLDQSEQVAKLEPTRPRFVIPDRPTPSPNDAQASDAFSTLRSESFNVAEGVVRRLIDNPKALCLLGKLHLRSGNSEVACSIWEHALTIDPNCGEAWLDLGNAVLLLGDQEKAELYFRNAVKSTKDSVDAQIALGKVLLDQGKLNEAVEQLDLLLKRAPNNLSALCKLGIAHQQLGNFSEAIRSYAKAITVDKDSWEAILGLQTAYRSSGDVENARKYTEQLADPNKSIRGKADIDNERSLEYFAFICQSASNLLLEATDIPAASATLEKALEKAPDSDQMRRQLVNIYVGQGKEDAAIRVLQTRCMHDPTSLHAWMDLAGFCMKYRRLGIAEDALIKSIELDSKQADAYSMLSQIQMTRPKDRQLAVETARQAVSLSPMASNHYILATAMYHAEDLAGAKKELTEAIRLEPNNQEFRQALTRLPAPK